MKHVLIPCFSNAYDREHDAVILKVDDGLLHRLGANRRAFDLRVMTDPDLHAHEYRGGPVYLLKTDDDVVDVGGPITLETYLTEVEYHGPWQLKVVGGVRLKVFKDGFSYTWDGQYNKHGPSEVYETNIFTLDELQGAD